MVISVISVDQLLLTLLAILALLILLVILGMPSKKYDLYREIVAIYSDTPIIETVSEHLDCE